MIKFNWHRSNNLIKIPNKSKFVYCAPLVSLNNIHKYRPYIEIPVTMNKLGFKSYLICGEIHFTPPKCIEVIQTGVVSNKQIHIMRIYKSIIKFLKKERPNIFVFFHMDILMPLFILYAKIINLNTKFVLKLDSDGNTFKINNSPLIILKRIYVSILSYFVDTIIIESECGKNELLKIMLLNKNKILLLPNTFSERKYKVLNYEDTERYNYILYVGRIHPEKDLDTLFTAFRDITNIYNNWNLHIVGPIEDKNYFEKLNKKYESLIKDNKIIFLGALYDESLDFEYLHASIFCLPSRNESFGIVRVEAMACGIPVITSEAGCGKEFKKYGSIIFPIGDYKLLEIDLRSLIKSKETRIEISKKQVANLKSYECLMVELLRFLGYYN